MGQKEKKKYQNLLHSLYVFSICDVNFLPFINFDDTMANEDSFTELCSLVEIFVKRNVVSTDNRFIRSECCPQFKVKLYKILKLHTIEG